MSKRERYTAKSVAKAIGECSGLLSYTARKLGCSRETVYHYVQKHPVCRQAMEDARDVVVDVAEAKLIEKIKAGEMPAIALALKTIGRHRGYVEKTEVEQSGSVDSNIVVHSYFPKREQAPE